MIYDGSKKMRSNIDMITEYGRIVGAGAYSNELDEMRMPSNVNDWLLENGFFSAPASTKYHGAFDGGLYVHSAEVTKILVYLTDSCTLKWEKKRSPFVVGMLHDICKIDQYRKLDEPNENGCIYAWNDTKIKGHGEKSVFMIKKLMELTEEEEACIRYHMGAFTDKKEWSAYTDAIHRFPNVLWTHHADMIATHIHFK